MSVYISLLMSMLAGSITDSITGNGNVGGDSRTVPCHLPVTFPVTLSRLPRKFTQN
jgi:hypothetical protein